jgi:D-proline reductase (dithiol) PrdB
MARLAELKEPTRTRLLNLECPTFENHPWVTGAPLARRRVAFPFHGGENGVRLDY